MMHNTTETRPGADQGAASAAGVTGGPPACKKVTTVFFDRSLDRWAGLSMDLIERFIEVQVICNRISRSSRRGCRSDLGGFDGWMLHHRGRTLVSARSSELRSYVNQRIEAGIDARLLQRLVASLHQFYRYVQETGCRSGNPAQRLVRERIATADRSERAVSMHCRDARQS